MQPTVYGPVPGTNVHKYGTWFSDKGKQAFLSKILRWKNWYENSKTDQSEYKIVSILSSD